MSSSARLVVIGLDGGDPLLLARLTRRGDVPNLAAIARRGLSAQLHSTVPPATLPAWTTFCCAAPPGHHGVVDMFAHPPGSYDLTPASGRLRRLPTFTGELAARGLRVVSLGVPGSYPPDPRLALCISGFDAPGASRAAPAAIHPPSIRPELHRLGGWRYAVVNEQRAGRGRLGDLARALVADLDDKERVVAWALAREPWDVLFLHLQAGDTAGHHLWHTFDEGSPRHRGCDLADALPSVYRRLDALVGHVLEATPGARVLVVSDHGMGGASDVAVHLNRALCELGLLRFSSGTRRGAVRAAGAMVRRAVSLLSPDLLGLALHLAPAALTTRLLALARTRAIAFGESAAFSDELDYAPSIWLNRTGRFARGFVDASRVPELRAQIRARLLALRHPGTGEPLIEAVHCREDAVAGPAGELAPDLLVVPAWPSGYRPSFLPSPGPGPVVRRLGADELSAARGSGMPGAHRPTGVLMAAGPGVPAGAAPALSLAEAGVLVYALAGERAPALPTTLSGYWAVLADSLVGGDGPRCPPPVDPDPLPVTSPATELREQALLERRLRDLGYL
jgi:predicted AlkP superfamily phosphohydrolase/phosphomutase